MTKDQIRAIFLGAGFTIKEGQTDLRPYVYDAAYCLLSASIADTAGAKPIGKVLSDVEIFDARIDPKMGRVIWFGTPQPGYIYATPPAPSVADAAGASERIAQLESALSTALDFIDDATIEEGQWHWLDDVRAAIAKESEK